VKNVLLHDHVAFVDTYTNSNVHTQEVKSSYAGARNNIKGGTNDNTKKGVTNRSNTRTPRHNIELYDLDKWKTLLTEVKELHDFKII
jgi:hypothetical protein